MLFDGASCLDRFPASFGGFNTIYIWSVLYNTTYIWFTLSTAAPFISGLNPRTQLYMVLSYSLTLYPVNFHLTATFLFHLEPQQRYLIFPTASFGRLYITTYTWFFSKAAPYIHGFSHSTCYIWFPTAADVPSEDNLLSGCPSPASTSGFFSFFFPFSIPFGRDEQVWGISLLLGMLFFRLYLIFLSITTYIWSSLEIHTIPCIFGYFFHGNTTYTWSIWVPTYYIWFLTAVGIPDYNIFHTVVLSCFRGWACPCYYQATPKRKLRFFQGSTIPTTSSLLHKLITCFYILAKVFPLSGTCNWYPQYLEL